MHKFIFILVFLPAIYNANCQPINKNEASLLDSMTTAVTGNNYTDFHSILISKDGKSIYEKYFNGWNKDSLQDSRSAFKSITSILAGIAVDKGFIKDVNQKVYSYFPEFTDFSGNNAWKKDMTIENILRMEAGFDCEEFNDGKDCETDMMATKDWIRFSLALPMKDKPGSVWAYTSCDPMIMSGIISRAAKMSIMEFAKKYLLYPMGIKHYRWTIDPSGNGMTAGSFYILPSDMMKIGEMVLQKGIWKGQRIISENWIKQSTNTPIPITDFSFVKFSKSTVAIPQPAYYGYYWYREEIKTKTFRENVLFASGNGGQYIMIIERLGIVVVFTQGNYNSWKAKKAFDLLAKYIIPAFEK
ncbi:serine hydrolase domain-containing protein [Pseudobacter ginsenosidimutans]|uniref:CubicO group peptidase (Beta-lactamase class C family) n=1 Tax=Pseudobacter ginsenosidimutans TaxID=661488 RepID=A0A4Q7N1V7_9BACT|nr:serine hydrolase [Pseudobacter ginsenosidimutans]QEC43793.1 serine hydrolase [Pseudobacter ginsenosidimutans]RZS75212.1 CubicO group peptidase (beta-lactamase class C family) [Pseudobacter ginsenosidimutans]